MEAADNITFLCFLNFLLPYSQVFNCTTETTELL